MPYFSFTTQNSNEERYEQASCCFCVWVQGLAESLTSISALKLTSRGSCRDLKGTIAIEIEEDRELFLLGFPETASISRGSNSFFCKV